MAAVDTAARTPWRWIAALWFAGAVFEATQSLITLHIEGPFYVGIGFTSHLPATTSAAKLSNVVLENRSGRIR